MAKKTRKKRTTKKSASAVLDLLDDEPDVEAPGPTPPLPPPAKKEPEAPAKPTLGKCGVCDKTNKEIAYADCDENWEVPGHPDHIFRFVCVDCRGDYESRDKCAQLVYSSMREVLREKGMDGYSIETAITIAHRSFMVEFDDKALIKMARQLKVTHPWLKGKRAK